MLHPSLPLMLWTAHVSGEQLFVDCEEIIVGALSWFGCYQLRLRLSLEGQIVGLMFEYCILYFNMAETGHYVDKGDGQSQDYKCNFTNTIYICTAQPKKSCLS